MLVVLPELANRLRVGILSPKCLKPVVLGQQDEFDKNSSVFFDQCIAILVDFSTLFKGIKDSLPGFFCMIVGHLGSCSFLLNKLNRLPLLNGKTMASVESASSW